MGASNTKSKRKVSACPYDVGRHMITYKQWHKKYVRNDPGSDLLYVIYNAGGESHPKDAVTVSEAIGYGMLCSAMTGHRQDFDKFLGFYEKHLNKNGLMCWQQVLREGKVFTNPDDDANGTGNATDGDLDAAYALFLAAREWKEAAYKKRGIEICAALWEWNFNHDTFITHLGDWCKKGLNERADKYWWVSRPSDYMLAHFALFAQEDTERAATWTRVLDTSIQTLVQLQELHPDTGLVPDFVVYSLERQRYEPSVGRILEKEQDGCYFWNACRVPWRLAVYYHHSKDVRVVPLLQKLQTFFEQQPIIHAGYELDGKPLADYSHIAFMAPVWCLFTVMGSNRRQWLEDKIRENRAGGHGNYYGESMEIICVLELQQQPLLVSPESSTVALTPVS